MIGIPPDGPTRVAADEGAPVPVLKSRKPRRPVALTGFAALTSGATFPITILDLSYDGCRIDAPVALLPGLAVKLSVERLGVIDAHVRWSEGDVAGLRFDSSEASETTDQRPRAHPRQVIASEALLRWPGRNGYRVRVSDVTCKGCKIEFVERPRVGDMLWAKFDGLEALEGRVRWVEDYWGGLEFVRPIHPAVFDLLLARVSVQTGETKAQAGPTR